jgi:Leucine Rich repeat
LSLVGCYVARDSYISGHKLFLVVLILNLSLCFHMRVLTFFRNQNKLHRKTAAEMAAAEDWDWRVAVDRVLREGGKELYLMNASLGDEEATGVTEKLRVSSNAVKKLYLGWNKIGDGGARSVAELLRSNPPALKVVTLFENNIGRDGIAPLAAALCHNTTVRRLNLDCNKGVDPDPKWGGSEAEAAAGIDALVAAIGVNTTLEKVWVDSSGASRHQKTINAALADTEGRRAGREHFLSTPTTKAARKRD